jgi:hypothetical protein
LSLKEIREVKRLRKGLLSSCDAAEILGGVDVEVAE